MALYDWNNDGKKDFTDNMIEYNIYQETTETNEEPSYTPHRGGGITTFGAIVSFIAAYVEEAVLFMLLGVDVENIPAIIVLIILMVLMFFTVLLADKMGL